MNGCGIMDYEQLVLATKKQILRSDLTGSTVHGTGFGPEISSQASVRYLQGPPLLVQAIAFTEVVRPHKPRVFNLKLSDGDKIINAFAIAPFSSRSLNFNDIQLGFKVSRLT